MGNDDRVLETFGDLRRLAAEDPKQARARIGSLIDSGDSLLDQVLDLAGRPGEGRLRQVIANAVRSRKDKARVVSHLAKWLEAETDEFAKVAISAALSDVQSTTFQSTAISDPPDIVETYRYIADRLCHRVRNSLTGPVQHLRKLETLFRTSEDSRAIEATATIAQLKDALRVVSRVVEFDLDDNYFRWRLINLREWLRLMTERYAATNSPLGLKLIGTPIESPVRANDFLLETLFWNLWKNAQQAVGSGCEVCVTFSQTVGALELLISDNGKGFSTEDAETAFIDQFRRRGANYGRGLLEVQDAVRRLGGRVGLVQVHTAEFRIRVSLPVSV